MAMTRPRQTTRWTPAAIPAGLLLMLLGAWEFFAPLTGPYFDYGFFTGRTWVFSTTHWELLLLPGIALFVGGLLITLPASRLGSLGGLVALASGIWLLVGPTLHPLWASTVHVATPHTQAMTSLLWIGYFYGAGAVAVYLSALVHGMLSRRTVVDEMPVVQETPAERRERVITRA